MKWVARSWRADRVPSLEVMRARSTHEEGQPWNILQSILASETRCGPRARVTAVPNRRIPWVSSSLCISTLSVSAVFSTGCSKDKAPPVAARTVTAAKAATIAPGQKQRPKACDMVTQSEMSAILGDAVAAAAGSRELPPSKTQCIYSSAAGSRANAELEVDWDDGDLQAMGTAAGLFNSAAAGAVDPLQGLGERAYLVTPWLVFISTTET